MRRGPNFTLRDRGVNARLALCLDSFLNVKAVVAAFNQEKALVGAFSVITNLRMELFEALVPVQHSTVQMTVRGRYHKATVPVSLSPGRLLLSQWQCVAATKLHRQWSGHSGDDGAVLGPVCTQPSPHCV